MTFLDWTVLLLPTGCFILVALGLIIVQLWSVAHALGDIARAIRERKS